MRIDTRGVLLSAAMLLPLGGISFAQEGRMTGIKLDGAKPIQSESDRLEVREADGLALFTGNVSVVQGPTLLRAGQMTVYYNTGDDGSAATGSADLDRLEVAGQVCVRFEMQDATGESCRLNIRRRELVLT